MAARIRLADKVHTFPSSKAKAATPQAASASNGRVYEGSFKRVGHASSRPIRRPIPVALSPSGPRSIAEGYDQGADENCE
jgi:hypothetical protein